MTTITDEQKAMLGGKQPRVYASYDLREAQVEGRDGRYLRGRAVPYDVWTDTGWYMERVMPGAFTKSIAEAASGLPLLMFHDSQRMPIGVATEWTEEPDGLVGLWRIDEADERAMQALDKAAKGMFTGLSIGFIPIEDWRSVDGELVDVNNTIELDETGMLWVTRHQGRLLETSLTPIPAYVGAGVLEVREILAARRDLQLPAAAVPASAPGTPRRDRLAARMATLGLVSATRR